MEQTLVAPGSLDELDDAELAAIGIDAGLIRLAVGVEETAAVVGDALGALDAATT